MQNFRLLTAHVKFHHICTLISSFCWKDCIKFQLKKYRGVMSHGTEEWCKIWRKSDLLFQKCKELGEIWSQHSEVSKICTLIGPFRAKYKTFDLRKYSGVIFYVTEESCKIWRKTNLCFGERYEQSSQFSPENLEVSKLGLWWDSFVQSRKCMS